MNRITAYLTSMCQSLRHMRYKWLRVLLPNEGNSAHAKKKLGENVEGKKKITRKAKKYIGNLLTPAI